jgi:hypothetical protein
MRHASKLQYLARRLAGAGAGQQPTQSTIPQRPPGIDVPLAWSQRHLYAIDRALGGTHLFNLPLALRITGRLDQGALSTAVVALVRRHEILRTRIEDSEPHQLLRLCDEASVGLRVFRLEEQGLSEQEAVRQFLAQDFYRTFELSQEPMFSARLLEIAPDDSVLSIVLHHLIADAYSLRNLLKELLMLYQAFSVGVAPQLPALPIQYADYAYWQTHEGLRELQPHLRYWVDRFTQKESEPERPIPVNDLGACNEPVRIDASLFPSLLNICVLENATLFMVLLSALVAVTSHTSRSEDIRVATLASNRQRPELEPLIGLLVNTIVLRFQVSPSWSFCTLLRRAREEVIVGYEHQEAPFDFLTAAHPNAVRPSDVMGAFIFQNTPAELPAAGELKYMRITPDDNIKSVMLTTFPFSLVLAKSHGEISGSIIYRQSCFCRSEITKLVETYIRVLTLVSMYRDEPIVKLVMQAATNY